MRLHTKLLLSVIILLTRTTQSQAGESPLCKDSEYFSFLYPIYEIGLDYGIMKVVCRYQQKKGTDIRQKRLSLTAYCPTNHPIPVAGGTLLNPESEADMGDKYELWGLQTNIEVFSQESVAGSQSASYYFKENTAADMDIIVEILCEKPR